MSHMAHFYAAYFFFIQITVSMKTASKKKKKSEQIPQTERQAKDKHGLGPNDQIT